MTRRGHENGPAAEPPLPAEPPRMHLTGKAYLERAIGRRLGFTLWSVILFKWRGLDRRALRAFACALLASAPLRARELGELLRAGSDVERPGT